MNLNDDPERELLSWNFTWQGDGTKGKSCVGIAIWLPMDIVREASHSKSLEWLADYVREKLGFFVAKSSGWGFSHPGLLEENDMILCHITVRAREVRVSEALG